MSVHEPLSSWTCDVCGDLIESVRQGYVVWRERAEKYVDYKIVHQGRCDPGAEHGYTLSLALEDFLAGRGLAMLLSWLSPGPLIGSSDRHPLPLNMDEYVDLVRRVQTPYYEEGRSLLNDPEVQESYADANEYAPYLPDWLEKLVRSRREES